MTAWPDKFVYVCSATQAAIVNALPIVHAGIERVSKIVIFCGAEDHITKDARLIREVIEPARLLQSAISDFSEGITVPTECIYENAFSLAAWTKHMRAVVKSASSEGLQVVYNLTGGTKIMSIGGLTGGRNMPTLVYVSGAPLRTEFLVNDQQIEAPRAGELSLRQYLSLYGVKEDLADRKQRNEQAILFRHHRSQILTFADLMSRAAVFSRLLRNATDRLFQKNYVSGEPTDIFVRGDIGDVPNGLFEALLKLNGIPGFSFNETPEMSLNVTNERAARFLRGGWLEAALFLSIETECAGRNDVEVANNVAIRFASAPEQTGVRDIGELDVAVMVRSQLHIVEAKTGGFSAKASRENAEQSIAQIDVLKRHLLGQFGRCIAVNPTEQLDTLAGRSGDFVKRAENSGIELALGPTAIADTVAKIRMVVGAPK